MRRTFGIAVVVALVLGGALAWALWDRRELSAELSASRHRLEAATELVIDAEVAHLDSAERADVAAEKARRHRERAEDLAERLYGARLELRRRNPAAAALVPTGREVLETKLLEGGAYDLLAVSWRGGGGAVVSGLDVWRVGRDADPSARRLWEVVYVAEPHPSYDGAVPGYVLHGPPTSPRREETDSGATSVHIAAVGDATGDGLEDLAIQQFGQGSGGCGAVKLLQNTGGGLREIYHREDCNHGIRIERGRLVRDRAAHPRGCDQIHGCGSRSTWMRWTGSSWTVTKVERDV